MTFRLREDCSDKTITKNGQPVTRHYLSTLFTETWVEASCKRKSLQLRFNSHGELQKSSIARIFTYGEVQNCPIWKRPISKSSNLQFRSVKLHLQSSIFKSSQKGGTGQSTNSFTCYQLCWQSEKFRSPFNRQSLNRHKKEGQVRLPTLSRVVNCVGKVRNFVPLNTCVTVSL